MILQKDPFPSQTPEELSLPDRMSRIQKSLIQLFVKIKQDFPRLSISIPSYILFSKDKLFIIILLNDKIFGKTKIAGKFYGELSCNLFKL
jgi:hypothetical protein